MLDQLPEELINYIYKLYYSKYVLTRIKPQCVHRFNVSINTSLRFKCKFNTIDSAYCMFCHHNFLDKLFN